MSQKNKITQISLRKKRLDELDNEEGMLSNERLHDPQMQSILDNGLKDRDLKTQRLEQQHQHNPDASSVPQDDEEMFEQQFGSLGVGSDGETAYEEESEMSPTPVDNNVDKDSFLPLEEVRELALSSADDYGYNNIEFDDDGKVISYIMPASARDRTTLKGLLVRLYEKTNESSGGKWNKENTLRNELAQVDTLNDLEVKHAIAYYKKIGIISKKVQHSEGEKYFDAPGVFRVNN